MAGTTIDFYDYEKEIAKLKEEIKKRDERIEELEQELDDYNSYGDWDWIDNF